MGRKDKQHPRTGRRNYQYRINLFLNITFEEKARKRRGRCGKIEGMEYIDLRKVGREGLKEIRRQVVRLKELGKTGKEIEELTGVRQNRASKSRQRNKMQNCEKATKCSGGCCILLYRTGICQAAQH